MQIILVSDRLSRTRSLTLSLPHLAAAGGAILFLVLALAGGLSYLTLRHAAEFNLPLLQPLVMAAQEQQAEQSQTFLRQNLNVMAVKLGEMQAQLMRLDALGERLMSMSGLKPSEFHFNEIPGRGGPLPSSQPTKNL